MKTGLLFVSILLFCFCSCDRVQTPEGTLENFVRLRFSGESNRPKLLNYLSGALHDHITRMSDEDFERFTDSSKIKESRFTIDLKKCEEDKCYITYTISYTLRESKTVSHGAEVKKIAELLKTEEIWRINSISNVKSYIEAEGINLPINR